MVEKDLKMNENCILCMNTTTTTIRIFDERVDALNIATILCQHFWLTFNEMTDKSKICVQCWDKTNAFHQFYESVRLVHQKQNENIERIKEDCDDGQWEQLEMGNEPGMSDDEDVEQTSEQLSTPKEQPAEATKNDLADDSTKELNDEPLNETVNFGEEDSEDGVSSNEKVELMTANRDTFSDVEGRIAEYFRMDCDLCGQVMSSLNDVRAHFTKKHRPRRGYLICCCNKKVKIRRSVIEHVKWHMDPNWFRCDECSKTFRERRALRKHIETHRTKDEDRVDCSQCGKRYLNQRSLAEHTWRVHPPENRKFTCDICQKSFKLKGTLESHMKHMHSRTVQRYICDICAKVLSTQHNLKEHARTHVEAPSLQCLTCGAMLKNRICLATHMKSHTDSKQTCDICHEVKANRIALNSHKRRVHGEAKHKCNWCEKMFKRTAALREHVATHTGENLYKCKYCPQTFKSDANMYKHMRQVHTEQWTKDRKKR